MDNGEAAPGKFIDDEGHPVPVGQIQAENDKKDGQPAQEDEK